MRPKGWKNDPDWLRYYEIREERAVSIKNDAEHNALMARAVAVQESDAQKRREHEAASKKHWDECHAEKVASGDIPDKARTQ